MARDQHALPRRQRRVELAADRLEPALQRVDLAIARVGPRQQRQRLDLLQQRRAIGSSKSSVSRGMTALIAARPTRRRTICSTSEISAGDGRTRICELTSARTRSRLPGVASLDLERHPPVAAVAREDLAERSRACRGRAGIVRRIATSRASRSRTLSSGAISDARIRDRLVVALELAAHEHHACRSRSARPRALIRLRETR